jgi:enamine deaminase RidA (YjgF/YER057c/UK114 family)
MTDHLPSFASPDGLIAPAGYSHVVSIPAGRLVWTSGQVPIDLDGGVPGDWEGQARLAFANVGHALRALGADWRDVVKLTYYVLGMEGLLAIRAIRDEYVDTDRPPTSSLIQVAGLFRPDLLLEIEAVAWLP